MRIIDILNQKNMSLSFEVFPPKKESSFESVVSATEAIAECRPAFMSVTYGAGGGTSRFTLDIAKNIEEKYQVPTLAHLTCVSSSRETVHQKIREMKERGIENVMALRGDSVAGERRFSPTPGGYAHADELVAAVRRRGGFRIGVGGYPEKHFEAANLEDDIRNLRRKVDAGADYIITQMFFDNSVFYRFVEKCRAAGITVPIIPGLKPLSSIRQTELLPQTFSIDIPQELASEVRKASLGSDPKEAVYCVGTEWCTAQCRDLAAHGVGAVHLYTMGKTRNITEILRNL